MATVGEFAVYATDSDGEVRWLMPGDEVPGWAVGQLGDHCLASGIPSPEPPPGPPPRAGRGASESAWREYAETHGVDLERVDGRDDVIATCEQAGIPT